jgi:hypothetical protein
VTGRVQKAIPCSYIDEDRCFVAGKARKIEGRKAEDGNVKLQEGIPQQSVACPHKYSQRQFIAL